jgi:hypothetical protein
MSFGGGGGGGQITAHKHTNASGEGGALDNTTLLNATALKTQIDFTNDHEHNSQSSGGAPLQFNNSIVTGSSIQINSGTEIPIEVLL